MTQVATRGAARRKRHDRIRLSLAGTEGRPRLAVFRSLNHIYAQVIDDASGKTLAAASTVDAAASVRPARSSMICALMCLLERNTARRGRSAVPCTSLRTR